MGIQLTPQEKGIFDFLLEVNAAMGLGTTFRAAGGWTRDKILGVPSDDIDIALDNLTGSQFEAKVSEYSNRYATQTGKPHPALGKTYTIKANPEKSKLLETVAIQINGLKVDFVNLREEHYDPTSRIPVMQMATGPDAAKKDAQRRDLTINSLFYNVNTSQVEDYVGGLQDLQTMTLRTPLDPIQTFKDDPLRMLRVLRFYSKYPSAKIDPSIVAAMQNPQVQNMYSDTSTAYDPVKKNYKVSPERAWPELRKIMEGKRPGAAVRILFKTGLYKAVFNTPKFRELLDLEMDQRNPAHAHNLLDHILHSMDKLNELMRDWKIDPETRMLMNFAVMFHDVGKAHPEIGKPHPKRPGQFQYLGHEDKSAEVAEEFLKSIGMGRRARSLVTQVIQWHMLPHSWPAAPGETKNPVDMAAGKEDVKYFNRLHDFLSNLKPIDKGDSKTEEIPSRPYSRGELAKLVLLHSMADSLGKDINSPPSEDVGHKKMHVQNMDAYHAWWSQNRPLMNGNDFMAMFPALDPAYKVGGESFIGELSQKLSKHQATGRIRTRQDAATFVEQLRKYIQEKYAKPTVAWLSKNCLFTES